MNKIEDYGLKAVKLAGEGRQLLMAAFFAFHADKALGQGAAFQIADAGTENPSHSNRSS